MSKLKNASFMRLLSPSWVTSSLQTIQMEPAKVSAVANWPTLDSQKKLQQFWCFANFNRKFIGNFSSVAVPPHALTSSKTLFQWSPQAEKDFQWKHKVY